MQNVILVRYGEIILKGLNRPVFEDKLISNIKKALDGMGRIKVVKLQGRIIVEPVEDSYDQQRAMQRLIKVFGIVSVSPVVKIASNFNEIKLASVSVVKDLLENSPLFVSKKEITFKVEAKRGDKKFPMESPEICAELGAHLLDANSRLKVDVHNPDFIFHVEVRENSYIYSRIIPSFGGLPTGTNGKAMLLLSGGIDSPVAGWMMGKRGVEIDAIHFYSYPYTSERAKDKVIALARILAGFCGRVNLHIVPFTEIQLAINNSAPNDHITLIMRRVMMRIAETVAIKTGSQALITGESMGQVASQTIQSLAVTNAVVGMPVFRPLIGMDKNEVIEIARRIDTFETSILPYEDCCTVFVAKHPKTKPKLAETAKYEEALALQELIDNAVAGIETIVC